MLRTLSVAAVTVLVLVGVAAAAGPSTVTVTKGTHTGGNPASLNAVDGDTLDIVAVREGKYVAEFYANFGTGFQHVSVDYAAWASHSAKCTFRLTPERSPQVRIGKTITSGRFDFGQWGTNVDFALLVRCKSRAPFTLRFDQLSATG